MPPCPVFPGGPFDFERGTLSWQTIVSGIDLNGGLHPQPQGHKELGAMVEDHSLPLKESAVRLSLGPRKVYPLVQCHYFTPSDASSNCSVPSEQLQARHIIDRAHLLKPLPPLLMHSGSRSKIREREQRLNELRPLERPIVLNTNLSLATMSARRTDFMLTMPAFAWGGAGFGVGFDAPLVKHVKRLPFKISLIGRKRPQSPCKPQF